MFPKQKQPPRKGLTYTSYSMANEPGLFRTVWSLALLAVAISYYVTGTLTWGFESRWLVPRYVKHRLFDPSPEHFRLNEHELSQFDGEDPTKPIYVAVDGMVFDVSSRPDTYGPIGAYHFFSGRDAARAFATGCFRTDLTHDLRELDDSELEAVKGWQQFFANSVRYWHVGYVEHPPLEGEPPKHCRGRQKP